MDLHIVCDTILGSICLLATLSLVAALLSGLSLREDRRRDERKWQWGAER